MIAFCNRGYTNDGRVITLNPWRATRHSSDDKQGVYVARTANCLANHNSICTPAGFRSCSRCASVLVRGKNNPRFHPVPRKTAHPSIRPPVINFALSRTTIFTLPYRAPLNSWGPIDITCADMYEHILSCVPSNSAQFGPARLGQQARRLRLPSKIARHIFTILLHF